jgi:hypothetical protein
MSEVEAPIDYQFFTEKLHPVIMRKHGFHAKASARENTSL